MLPKLMYLTSFIINTNIIPFFFLTLQTFFTLGAHFSILLNLSVSSSPNLLFFSASSILSLYIIVYSLTFSFSPQLFSCKFRWCTKDEISIVVYKTKICYAPTSMEEMGYNEPTYYLFFFFSKNQNLHGT
jgi:hypothetical protein